MKATVLFVIFLCMKLANSKPLLILWVYKTNIDRQKFDIHFPGICMHLRVVVILVHTFQDSLIYDISEHIELNIF